jgi:cobalt-precorrin 5A hydrolase
MKIAIIAITAGGVELAEKICAVHNDCAIDRRKLSISEKMASLWQDDVDAVVCVMATGIVVRALAPLCKDKQKDPCVLVLDERGEYVISLLSGHIGGGNELARELATKLGAHAVITTASDVTGHTALDLWAKKNGLLVADKHKLTSMSAKLVNCDSLKIFTDCEVSQLPNDFHQVQEWNDADIIVSDRNFAQSDSLFLRPCCVYIGLGCNRGTDARAFKMAITELLAQHNIAPDAVACYASIDLKNDEAGMLTFVRAEKRTINFYTKDQLNSVHGISESAAVLKATGAKGVAEPAAILAAGNKQDDTKLIVRKQKWKDVTAAIAVRKIRLRD